MPQQKIGALWTKEQRGGGTHQTGEIELPTGERLPIIVFRNSYKTATNRQPEHIIYLRDDRPQSSPDAEQDNQAPSADEVF